MLRKWLIPVLAVGGVTVAAWAVVSGRKPVESQPPLVPPATNPYAASVSGPGILEAASENIAVAPAIGGIVTDIFVKWGEPVHAGTRLFQIDDRPLKSQIAAAEADLAARRAAVQQALANVERLKAAPRAEDIPIAKAKVGEATAAYQQAEDNWQRAQKLGISNALGADEFNQRKFAFEQSRAALSGAQADLAKLLAGAWKQDLAVAESAVAVARADVQSSEARLASLQVDLARLTVTAPVDGTVLRINVRRGEYAPAAGVASAENGAVVLGDTQHLNVRMDIDENDAPRFSPQATATAFVRGRTDSPIALRFVRVEPFVIPKRNLTGGALERVDTRVLQVIYAVAAEHPLTLYVGQQVDVFVNTAPAGK